MRRHVAQQQPVLALSITSQRENNGAGTHPAILVHYSRSFVYADPLRPQPGTCVQSRCAWSALSLQLLP